MGIDYIPADSYTMSFSNYTLASSTSMEEVHNLESVPRPSHRNLRR